MVYGYDRIPNSNIIGFLAEKSLRKITLKMLQAKWLQ